MGGEVKDDGNWLIKSGDRILGPFTGDQIKSMLYEKELVVIDEVTAPLRRWRYIRDEPAFALVVEEVRKAHLSSREDTELGSHTGTSITETHSATPTDFIERKAPQGQSGSSQAPLGANERPATNAKPAAQAPPRAYGSGTDRKVQADIGQSTRLVWIAAIVILAGAAVLFLRLQTPQTVDTAVSATTLAARAALAKSLGDFRTAITAYDQLHDSGQATAEMQIDLAVLRLRLHDESSPPSRILDSIKKETLGPSALAQYETARGLVGLNDSSKDVGHIKEANAHFAKALESDRSFAPAAFNAAMSSYLLTEFEPGDTKSIARIANEFLRVAEMPSLDTGGRIAAKLMSSLIRLKSGDQNSISQASEDLGTLQKSIVQYWQEASLMRAFARQELGQNAQAQRDLRITLGADPFVTDEHLTDPYLYTTPLSWQGLRSICERIYEAAQGPGTPSNKKQDPAVEATLYFCRFKAGDSPENAREKLRTLEARYVSDPLIRSVSAFTLMKISPDEAKAKLADASDSVSWELGRILSGRLCSNDDLACLYRAFRTTSVLRTAIYFQVGAARYSLQQAQQLKESGDQAGSDAQAMVAKETIDAVRSVSPNYIPLLTLEAREAK